VRVKVERVKVERVKVERAKVVRVKVVRVMAAVAAMTHPPSLYSEDLNHPTHVELLELLPR
jgi:hypothetical protein